MQATKFSHWGQGGQADIVRPYCAWRTFLCTLIFLTCSLSWTVGETHAADFQEGFDGPKTSWSIAADGRVSRVVEHRRQTQLRRFGTHAEQVILDAKVITRVELTHRLSPARALDELSASVWVRSNRTGAKLSLRLVFPHLNDPKTGQKVVRWLEGDSYTSDNTWQILNCRTAEKEVQRRTQLLRATLGSDIDVRDIYVDRAMISAELGTGTTEICFDELKLGPVVSPASETPLLTEETPDQSDFPDLKLQHDRLTLNGQPFFLTFLPDHQEPAEELADLGFKLAWVPHYDDAERLRAFKDAGMGCIATPPSATTAEGQILDADSAGLAPLGDEFDPIWCWMLGNGLSATERTRMTSWQKQMLSADRKRQRPFMAGVIGSERSYSRIVSMLGTSRTVQQSGLSYLAYRDWLTDRQMAARPGIFRWTWIDVEPSREIVASRRARGLTAPHIEPDQLKQQVYAALSSGLQGLGFWSIDGLFQDAPGSDETRLMLKQLHLELRLLEPWLATGSVVGHARFELTTNESPRAVAAIRKQGATPIGYRVPSANSRTVQLPVTQNGSVDSNTPHVEATLIESDFGTLLLGMWYDPDAQFVSGQMAARNVQIVVPGIKETAKAWEITSTEIRPLKTDRNARPGGTLISLDRFDMTTAIVISSDLTLGDKLRAQVAQIQAQSAITLVQLADIKFRRVQDVIEKISQLGHPQIDDERMLVKSRQYLNLAIESLKRKEYSKARDQADLTMRMLRVLQRAHWDAARDSLAKLYLPRQLGPATEWGFQSLAVNHASGRVNHAAFRSRRSGSIVQADASAAQTPAAQAGNEPPSELKGLFLNASVAGPHTCCFQTLPDHWALVNRIQINRMPSFAQREAGETGLVQTSAELDQSDLLRFGDFESDAEFQTAGWEHLQSSIPRVTSAAELVQTADRRGYCLRLIAAPAVEKGAPLLMPAPPVTFMTPEMTVHTGEVFRIHGWLKVPRTIVGSRDGFEISDTLGGPDNGLHWHAATPGWTRFEIIRDASENGPLKLTFTLHGLGEVLLDDVKIEPVKLRSQPLTNPAQ